ncbi:MAG: hypothetical protein HY286_15270 [Planctomycetes bacterium]|nr:hypothetical protein [Planctomycetota bacterium]
MIQIHRIAIPSFLIIGAFALALGLSTRHADAAPQGDKITKDAVTARVEAFLTNLNETTKRADFIAKMCEGGPIDGLKPNQSKISELADAEIQRYGVPAPGADGIALADEKNISNFICARTYVIRCDRGPSVWHFMLYNGSKGWGVYEMGISPNAHCLIPTWRDFNFVPVRDKNSGPPQPANANGNR